MKTLAMLIKYGYIPLITFTATSYAHPLAHNAVLKRSVDDLDSFYDYVIVGGGTSGLTVANRLTEDPSKTVLVVELGDFADGPCTWMPKNTVNISATPCRVHVFNITTQPIKDMNGFVLRRFTVGMAVGGSSAVNGMVFDRASKADYNAWEELGNPGWGWDGLYDYFKKSASFGPPSHESTEKYGYTWDSQAYGPGPGPIWATFPPFQWPGKAVAWDAWGDLNVPVITEHAAGNAVGRYWAPASQHPINQTRSYARFGHYEEVKTRPNYHLLIGHKVEKLKLSSKSVVEGVVVSERFRPRKRTTVKVSKEAILAAGAVHTPKILQLSGIGPRRLLETAGIEVQVDLPGVGQNLQDHPQATLSCNFTRDLWPNPATLFSNETFMKEAQAEYDAHKSGPLTLSLGTSFAFLALSSVYEKFRQFVSDLKTQSPESYLPANSSKSIISGFKAQQRILASLFASEDAAAYEASISGTCSRTLVILRPVSRGTININSTDPSSDPIVDMRTYTNPLDIRQAVEFVRFTRNWMRAPSLAKLGPVELCPGSNVTSDEELIDYVRATSFPTSFHPAGTAAMMPKHLGGVVGSDLKVYDVGRLSVVDASIMPLIPASHLSATVYAVAEKAADIIKSRN